MKTQKFTCDTEPFTFDWTKFYERHGLDPVTDPITSSTWDLTGSGAKGVEAIASPETSVFLSGGTVGETMLAVNTIQIRGGVFQACRTLRVEIL